ncbi:Mechanosensitive ion channel family protein [Euphorbia peplus]|nr:Mechanosensitive ion channel family protein [Euphorbia peplus]
MLVLFLILRFFCVNEKAVYFGYGVRKSVVLFVWVGQVALAWGLIVDRTANSNKNNAIVNDVMRGLSGCVIGAILWVVKTFVVKLVGCNHATKLLEKTREAIYMRKLLVSLLKTGRSECPHPHPHRVNSTEESVHVAATKVFYKLFDPDKHDSETMWEGMNAIRSKRLKPLPFIGVKEVATEAAKELASDIFEQLDPHDYSNGRCISLQNILQFVKENKVIDQLKGLAETKIEHQDPMIEKSAFQDWMVEVYMEYDALDITLNHRKSAMDELNMIASLILLLIIIVTWLLFMDFLTTKVLVFISSQLLLVTFMFGNSAKSLFEDVIFVFLVHPFDVGDRCVVNGIQMIVEEMSIKTTTFLRYDNEKIYYPNSVLASKPISNLYRSPPMSESLEFAISLHTPNQTIENLQESIKTYLKENPRWWRPDHSLQFKEIEDVNKMKLALSVNHTINFHYMGKRMKRRSELVLLMKNLFEKFKIEYNLLPQQVNLMGSSRSLSDQFD